MVLTTGSRWTLSALLDYFIPKAMIVDVEQHRRARMFMLSHAFGPILGNSLPVYMYVMGIARDYRVFVFFLSILAFWIYPVVLRKTGRYKPLAFLSVQNVGFTVIWACYAFGGLLSPFLPWMLILPLLAFLYFPSDGWERKVLLGQIFGSLAVLVWVGLGPIKKPPVNFADLQVIGMVSMASVALYFAMMALYFAKMYHEQREFGRELNSLVSSSDNLRNLTSAAKQAGAAKADFIASMSHELRTPLNAIIGYSQLLMEEAEDEGDDESMGDLQHVHQSGNDLLYLIDQVLNYSRIDAGKMPVNPSLSSMDAMWPRWQNRGGGEAMVLIKSASTRSQLFADWDALGSALVNLTVGALGKDHAREQAKLLGYRVEFALNAPSGEHDPFTLRATLRDAAGTSVAIRLETMLFAAQGDESATKYGASGIELALANKYIALLGGALEAQNDAAGEPCLVFTLPQGGQEKSESKLAA
jgi:nitrogen-specific signal transduction histidine kinase